MAHLHQHHLLRNARPSSHISIASSHSGFHPPVLRQWDGRRRTYREWNSQGRDPELWTHDGNCFIYLHKRGFSKSGPSFKIPFSALLAADCFPFIKKYLSTTGFRPQTVEDMRRWYGRDPRKAVELYIPSAPSADREHALEHYLTVRNFMAWIVGKTMVGESLGSALLALYYSLADFRSNAHDDSLSILWRYMKEQGYLQLADESNHAMALLYLAESLQLRDVYIQAFTHCVGMCESLYLSTEYSNVSVTSRDLVRRARVDMDDRTARAATMLSNFLDDELSEAYMGIPAGLRSHLNRFRGFLKSFYLVHQGFWPPRIFNADIYRALSADFAALFELLQDESYTSSNPMPSTAAGGICVLQLAQSFDERHDLEPHPHPLPLLPHPERQTLRPLPWLSRRGRSKAVRNKNEVAALVGASNTGKPTSSQNDLVRAYRRFEEDSVALASQMDRSERVPAVERRKACWILVYAAHQILCNATVRPEGVSDDASASYLVAAPATCLPPWEMGLQEVPTPQGESPIVLTPETPTVGVDEPWDGASVGIEIKPDIDYFAITHRPDPHGEQKGPESVVREKEVSLFNRTNSFTRVLSRSSTIRRSLRRFRQSTYSTASVTSSPGRMTHHEIVVHGYGNGTNAVLVNEIDQTGSDAAWKRSSGCSTDSSASSSSFRSALASLESQSPAESPRTSLTTPSPKMMPEEEEEEEEDTFDESLIYRRWSSQSPIVRRASPPVTRSPTAAADCVKSGSVQRRRPTSATFASHSYSHSADRAAELSSRASGPVGVMRRHSNIIPDLKRKCAVPHLRPMVLPNAIVEEPSVLKRDSCDWTAMQSFLDGKTAETDTDGCPLPAWEQYADLGGLTPVA